MIQDELIKLLPLNRIVLDRAGTMQLASHSKILLRMLDALHGASGDLNKCRMHSTPDAPMRAACEQFAIALTPAAAI